MMNSPRPELVGRTLTTPRAAAVAGLLFAVLFGTVLVLMRTSLPAETRDAATRLGDSTGGLTAAVILMPFAGIAFLWFLGVVRDRLGELEDRFFASVMFGSGLMFLAMTFVAMALAGGILAAVNAADATDQTIIRFGREVMFQITNVYALRMAGVFMISTATIWLRTGLMPRWLAAGTYILALVLLLVVTFSLWVTLVFPAWVFLVSVLILVTPLQPHLASGQHRDFLSARTLPGRVSAQLGTDAQHRIRPAVPQLPDGCRTFAAQTRPKRASIQVGAIRE